MYALKLIFFVCAFLIVHHYVLYPALVIWLARSKSTQTPQRPFLPDAQTPSITVVIAAYNEERVIAAKLRNTLSLDYPREKLRVMVAADGSDDGTVGLAQGFADQGVRVLHHPARRGKTAALNRAVADATSEVIVFSDANNMFNPDALRHLVKHFADEQVGGVCGLKHIVESHDRESAAGDSMYWRYESAIKMAESHLGSITTADGEIFAVRRSLYHALDEALINDDAAITFDLIRANRRVLYEPQAKSSEQASICIEDDFNVKVRMVSGGFQTLAREWRYLIPPRHAFAWTFLSHKVLRWTAPELLLIVMALSIVLSLAGDPLFMVFLALQVMFYALALLGWQRRHRGPLPMHLYVPFYFCAMNTAALFGLHRHLTRSTQWKKAAR